MPEEDVWLRLVPLPVGRAVILVIFNRLLSVCFFFSSFFFTAILRDLSASRMEDWSAECQVQLWYFCVMILASCRELVVARNDIGVNQKEICVIFFFFCCFYFWFETKQSKYLKLIFIFWFVLEYKSYTLFSNTGHVWCPHSYMDYILPSMWCLCSPLKCLSALRSIKQEDPAPVWQDSGFPRQLRKCSCKSQSGCVCIHTHRHTQTHAHTA